MTDPPALQVDHVRHVYGGRVALDDVSITVRQGRFAVLLGQNGAGKTTLFSIITRLFDTRRGSVTVLGHRIDRAPTAALRQLGVVFQARTLDLDLSVAQNLSYAAALHGYGPAEARARTNRLLDEIGLRARAGDKARSLSGGQMRRVEIARALLHEPRLLVLDEPTVGLDVASRAAILALVRRLVASGTLSVLWATHLLDEVEESDDLVVLHQGRVLASGTVAALLQQHRAQDVAALFSTLTAEPA